MNPMLQAALGAILRWGLTILATLFVNHGIWTQSEAAGYVVGASLGLLTLGWTLWNKYKGRVKFLTALKMQPGTTEAQVEARVASTLPNPPVSTPKDMAPLILVGLILFGASACAHAPKHTAVVGDTALFEILSGVHSTEQVALCGQPSCAGVTASPTVPGWTLAKSQDFNRKFLPAVEGGRQFNLILGRWDPTQPAPPELRALIHSLGDALAAVTADFPDGNVKGQILANIGKGEQIVLNIVDLVVLAKGGGK